MFCVGLRMQEWAIKNYFHEQFVSIYLTIMKRIHTHTMFSGFVYACICLPTDTLMAELVLTWYQTERMLFVVTHSAFYLCSHQVLYTHGSIHSQPSCVLLIKNVLESDCSRLFEMVVGLT